MTAFPFLSSPCGFGSKSTCGVVEADTSLCLPSCLHKFSQPEELQPPSPRPGFSALQTKISMTPFFIPVLFALVQSTVADMLEKTAASRGPRGSGQVNLVPTLEEPSSSWLLQEDGFDTQIPIDFSWTGVQKRPALPNVPDVLILALAALTLGVSVLLRELCRAGHDQKQQKPISVKPSETTDAFGCTELHVAASEGSALNVRKLLEGGSDPNAREAWEENCFRLLTKNLYVERCFKMMFTHKRSQKHAWTATKCGFACVESVLRQN